MEMLHHEEAIQAFAVVAFASFEHCRSPAPAQATFYGLGSSGMDLALA